MNGLSLFSGAGIGELAFKHILPDYRTVGYVDNDKYCQAVIRARIRDGVLDNAPLFGDIREFNARFANMYAGKVDWLSAGFPCQPFSVAGRQLGEADERNCWPATRDAISIIRPGYVFLENVPALISSGYFDTILNDLVEIGFDRIRMPADGAIWEYRNGKWYIIEWDVVSAAFVGAPHIRKRLWILAQSIKFGRRGGNNGNEAGGSRQIQTQGSSSTEEPRVLADANGERRQGGIGSAPETGRELRISEFGESGQVSDATGIRLEGIRSQGEQESKTLGRQGLSERNSGDGNMWSVEPDVGRVAHGVAYRVDRLKCVGNGWVPQVVRRVLEVRET